MNNPFNIKVGTATQSYIDNGQATVGPAAPDGGNFLTFKDRSTAVSAAQNLLFSSGVYKGLTVDAALKKWSNNAYGGDLVPGLSGKTIDSLTPDEQTQVLNAMETKGENDAVAPGTLTLQGLKPGSFTIGQKGQPQGQGGNWLTDSIKGMVTGTGQDFASLGQMDNYLKGPGNPDFWKTLGGNINALSDVAMAGGILVGDIASGGADTPLDPAEMAAGMAARDAAEKGGAGLIKKGLQSTVGRFAAGKGVGLAAQSVASGASSAAQTKAKGGSNVQAAESGTIAAGTTALTFGIMNKFGPKVTNGFVNLIAKTKFGPAVGKALGAAVEYLKSTTGMTALKDTGNAITEKLNAAAEQVVAASHQALGGIAAALKTPTVSETGAMVQRVSANVAETGNRVVEGTFNRALTALSKFKLSAADAEGVAKELATGTGGKVTSMAEALAGDAEATVSQRSQMLLMGLKNGGTETVDKIINGLNIKTPEAVEATLTSKWWQAIKDVVGKTPEGKAALQQYTDAMTARAQQNEQATFADTMRHAMAGGWQRVVGSTFAMLKDAGSVQNLQKALGQDFPTFQKDLTQKIVAEATAAYQHVVTTASGNITPKVSDDAQKALAGVIDKYVGQLGKLPALLPSKTIAFLSDMKNGIPTVSTLADNLGIDGSKIVDEKGAPLLAQGVQTAQKATQEAIDMVRNSPVGKAIASGKPSAIPQAILGSSKEEIQSLKTMLGENSPEWKTVTASALGKIMQNVTGLFSTATHDDAEKFLEDISAKVGGDAEKYNILFGTASTKAKDSAAGFIESISNLANATKKGSLKTAGIKAAASVLGFAIHHPFMGFMLARESLDEFVGKESSDLIKALASKTPAQIRAEISKEQLAERGVPSALIKTVSAINQYLGPIIKYELAKTLGQNAGGIVGP
jgi:hypothetical protein